MFKLQPRLNLIYTDSGLNPANHTFHCVIYEDIEDKLRANGGHAGQKNRKDMFRDKLGSLRIFEII